MATLSNFPCSLPLFYLISGFGAVIYNEIRDKWNLESIIIGGTKPIGLTLIPIFCILNVSQSSVDHRTLHGVVCFNGLAYNT